MRTLLIDHHDSFSWNLVQAVAGLTGALPEVVAHDDEALRSLDWSAFDAVLLSPGPGHPARAADALYTAHALGPGRPPALGVCLGMQVMAHTAGATVDRAPEPRHGRISPVSHTGSPLFDGIPSPGDVVRYHSLACTALPDPLEALAWSDDGVTMALRHRTLPWWGVQFHPESIASPHGARLLANFLRLARSWNTGPFAGGRGRAPATPPDPAPRSKPPSESERAPRLLHARLGFAPDTVSVFQSCFRHAEAAVWLDGAAAPDRARYSVFGDSSGPLAYTLTYRAGTQALDVRRHGTIEHRTEGLLAHLRAALAAPTVPVEGLDLPFALGFVGSLGYELRADFGSPVAHPSALPDAHLLHLDRAVVVDHARGETHLLALEHPDNRAWLAAMPDRLAALPRGTAAAPVASVPRAPLPPLWRHDDAAYRARVARAQSWLADGESYELCLTNRACAPHPGDPLATYLDLRRRNPAPYAAFLRFPGMALLSSSPERFLRVDTDGRVTAAPIKGTRRRAALPAEDRAAAEALRTSEKDRSENLMITDLLRNDLGRVCAPGSIHVPALFRVESFAHVHQLVSVVEGRLETGRDALDLIAASFPPGSMTGAPKLRSMALLEALEEGPRGPYSGAIGYLSRCGGADLAVVIRSIVVANGEATVGVGGAVVALSDPDAEVSEMLLKAEPMLEALAQSGA